MRLSSLLPILLLLASPLSAQQNCHIFDLTATAVQFNPLNCQFFVVLNFQHTGTTNQFNVKGSGNFYGTFQYGQVPVVVGPLTASTTGPTTFEFVVQDAVLQDCQDATTLTVPACGSSSGCDIFDLNVQVGDCHPNDGTYAVTINFQASNPGNDFFEVFTVNGTSLGTFPLSSLPLTIQNFPWGGGPIDVLKVCINDQFDCCAVKEIVAPNCFGSGCDILDLNVQVGDCISDSTYKALINFELLNNTGLTDSFQVFLNGNLQGTYGLNQLPLPVVFESNGASAAVVKVCANVAGITCCKEKEIHPPVCQPPCAITFLKIETDSCTSDSTFGVWVNFQVADPTVVDSFDLWGNGQYLGHFGMNQLPLNIPNFEWNGLIFNTIKICTGNEPGCCKERQFLAPECLPYGPCEITNIFTLTGACTSDSTYKLLLNFNATNPGNGTFLLLNLLTGQADTFQLTDLPLAFTDFPWHGEDSSEISICILGNNLPPSSFCCRPKKFDAPDCLGACDITGLHAVPGDCDPNTQTYPLTISFQYVHPGNDFFNVFANGQLFGTYPLNQLPLTIPNYPSSGNNVDVIKVCINDQPNCCAITEFETPNCGSADCHVFDLLVEVGDCNQDGTYHVTIKFGYTNPGNDFFDVYANGQLFGTYNLNQLPLHIPNFPSNGAPFNHIKVCINDHPDCCIGKEFQAPNCDDCEIVDLNVVTGDCNPDSTYHLTVNFQALHTTATTFVLFGNGQLIGTFNLSQLPLHIPNFPWDGAGPNDFLKVCVGDNSSALSCCKTLEFPIPDCLHGGQPCDIFDLHVDTGNCTSDSSYVLTFNFHVSNPPANTFGVWANGQFLGMYGLGQLPITIQNFPWNGGNNDVLKVCFPSNTPGTAECCDIIEFPVPDCLFGNGDCEIYDLVADPGGCTSDSTYVLGVNFQFANAPSDLFGLWGNGVFLGTFNVSQLPLHFNNFQWNGGAFDAIKVCFVNQNGGPTNCCKTIEFQVPDCLGGGDCEIHDMVVDPGDCSSDSTYSLFLNFQVNNPPGNMFGVWANGGAFLGTFNLSQLPLNFPNFPWNGGTHDAVKVCFLSSGAAVCCRTIEFAVPDCLGNNDDCNIYDVLAVRTGCLCGQFFVALTFQHDNGGSGGFDVVGNGNNYGTYPYNTQQPIILGPFPGDGTTIYEFGVVDHLHPDCEDGFVLGVVECATPIEEPGRPGNLSISPNPASTWLNVAAMLENGMEIGQATVKVFHADGRLLQSQTISNAGNFQMDISGLPSGVYRLSIISGAGSLEGSFTKQ